MNSSQLKQVKVAVSMYKTDPERLKLLYMSGRLRLCYIAMFILYLHYIQQRTFENIRSDYSWGSTEKLICDLFIDGDDE
ncbi:hypothetical protein pEaSNUABM50_00360 [Erwinia phage pEa_SNUABM_50]|uniref:Uncharacterized protein n=4 Tax=Eneladusvirus BF TaxID=2560751 RepID=A0A7L8ZMZ2_9CAUD|nr:hypothetical protein FDH34_gp364 [Serratia phage BF]QOI71302.1 hypothetical protein pEaSNUABM12_00364 [Erwinia phage pEa_SNUABM_12]QOI71845.1 hypothetical protein pEaSNUABM47_00361 [Erwinia phage pEa_SNUABM_47]QOI72384.1 hypothetical protein pEaSNUABM50_00360 [Erwinia phage pEa_SNUABM_50]QXO11511.1 hypothetical protein pEaSNUABM19_00365 [Erwinia phage pEa_SNUABM_19]QXO12059.1 hypothetical protein pEaSNUABM44_00363 [Erwinia phage pEa_SNUABM_44]QXO12612.1 hypothetical protein pEaSNUABM49_003